MDTDSLLLKLNALDHSSNLLGVEGTVAGSELVTPELRTPGEFETETSDFSFSGYTEPATPYTELDASIADLSGLIDHFFNSQLLDLPDEVILCILQGCDRKTIFAVLCACDYFYSNSEYYFKRIVKHLFAKDCSIHIHSDITWRWLFDSKEPVSEELQANFTGIGKKKLFKNDFYEGEFLNGMCHGKGTYYWARGDKYIGEWKNGFQDGTGVLVWQGGNKYEGGWKNGLRHGSGVYSWEVKGFNFNDGASRDTFEGTWINGVRQGQGKYKWANGNVCEGVWQVDVRSGGNFYEKLTDRNFYAPDVDSADAEINLALIAPKIRASYQQKSCTYSVTGKDYYFQYLWETTHEMPYNGVCITCKETCVQRNQIDLSQPVKFIFGGKFVCPCGAGFYKHPCRAMGLYDPQIEHQR